MALVIEPEVEAAAKEVRAETSDTQFVVAGYKPGTTELTVLAKGTGGFAEVCNALVDSDFCYGYYRTTLQIDNSKTTKFVYVQFSPDAAPPMRKALVGTFAGRIAELFQPFHVDLKASERGDLSEAEAISKLEAAAGIKHHVISAEAAANRTMYGTPGAVAAAKASVHTKGALGGATAEGAALGFDDEAKIRDAIKDVRNDSTETDWALVGYASKDKLGFVASGSGGVTALLEHVEADKVNYGIFRTTELIDKSTTVKFIFVQWQPDTMPLFQKAIIATHKGVVEGLFSPYHTDFRITEKGELSDEIVNQRLADLSGKGAHAQKKLGVSAPTAVKKQDVKGTLGGATAGGATVDIDNKDAILDAIKQVRTDNAENDWVVVGYQSTKAKVLQFVSCGSGSVTGMMGSLPADSVAYGLLRVTEQIDKSTTTKFVFVQWQPESVSPMMKATVSTHKGVVRDLFGQWHVDFFVTSADELTQDLVDRKVGEASGALSRVKL